MRADFCTTIDRPCTWAYIPLLASRVGEAQKPLDPEDSKNGILTEIRPGTRQYQIMQPFPIRTTYHILQYIWVALQMPWYISTIVARQTTYEHRPATRRWSPPAQATSLVCRKANKEVLARFPQFHLYLFSPIFPSFESMCS